MRAAFPEIYQRIDSRALGLALVLAGFGLVLIHSLTWSEDNRFIKQVIFLGIGIAVLFGVQFLDVHFWRNASLIFYIATIILLAGLVFFGEETRGVRGWISLGSVGFQPAEFAKIATILFLATTLERLHFDLAKLKHVALAVFIVGLPIALTSLQPDVGSAFILLISGIVMILYTGLDKKKLALLFFAGLAVVFIGWFGVLQDYQKGRVLTFMNPQSDPLGAGYNVTQAIVAIGSGGIFGRGLGLGTQSQLDFLPEQATDFIFASLAEELGFTGSFIFLLAYLLLLWRIYLALKSSTRAFPNFLMLGIFIMFFSQTAINISMNMGLFPVTGVPLPFVSYGGSSLVMSFLSLGLVMRMRDI